MPDRTIKVKVFPGAGKNGVAGWNGDELKVKTCAQPEKGKANNAVIEILAEHFGVKKSSVQILRGHTSRHKVVEIINATMLDAK